ncbi:hypothetical protein T09_3450, partial [Trichinella sp. T9]
MANCSLFLRLEIQVRFGTPGGALLYARNFALGLFPTTCCSAVANECCASLVNGCAPFCQATAAADSIILPLASPELFNNDKSCCHMATTAFKGIKLQCFEVSKHFVGSGLLTRFLLVSVFAVTDTRPRDFLAYALFTFVKASAASNVNCIRSFWLLLAASLVLRSLLYCSHPFTTATWSVQKNSPVPFSTSVVYLIQCSQHPLQIYAAHVLDVFFSITGQDTSTKVFSFLFYRFTLHTDCVQTGADVEGTPTSLFQLFLRFQWRVLQSVSPNRSDGVEVEPFHRALLQHQN